MLFDSYVNVYQRICVFTSKNEIIKTVRKHLSTRISYHHFMVDQEVLCDVFLNLRQGPGHLKTPTLVSIRHIVKNTPADLRAHTCLMANRMCVFLVSIPIRANPNPYKKRGCTGFYPCFLVVEYLVLKKIMACL